MNGSADPIMAIIHRWRTVSLLVALGVAAAVAYLSVAPRWYSATLSVVPSQRGQDSAALSLAARLPLEPVSTDVQRIQAVLNSTSVADEVIDRFSLISRYDTTYREKARETLAKHCSSSADKRSGVVALTCEDQDPKRAMDMATAFGEVGNRVLRRVSSSSASEERRFLEQQVKKARIDVDEASRKLKTFQEQYRIIDLPEQSKAVISAMASIKGELISKQLELSYLSSFSAKTESSVMQAQQQIAIMEAKLQQLEREQKTSAAQPTTAGSGSGQASKSDQFFPNAMNVPGLRFELELLMREQKIQETVFSLLTQRFEMAKVDEARDTSTFQILDYPTLPSYPTKPRKLRVIVLGAIGGSALGAALILLPIWIRRRKRLGVASAGAESSRPE